MKLRFDVPDSELNSRGFGRPSTRPGTKAAFPQVRLVMLIEAGTHLDIELFPSELLAKEYHQRWEVENTIDELKTHLLGRKTPMRSPNPREVVQEVYGWLLGHWAVRFLMFQTASAANIAQYRSVKRS